MNRYWNFSEKERAAMTRENVQAFIDVELMEKGVLKVEPPVLQEIQQVEVPTSVGYEVLYVGEYHSDTSTGFAFTTPEQADAFVKLYPMKIDTKWEYGTQRFLDPCRELKIQPITLPSVVEMSQMASILKANKAAKDANEKALENHRKAMKVVEDATKGLWDDWQECREKSRRCQKVADTRAEYLKLSGGDAEIAETFLKKVLDEDRIAEAAEWFATENAQ